MNVKLCTQQQATTVGNSLSTKKPRNLPLLYSKSSFNICIVSKQKKKSRLNLYYASHYAHGRQRRCQEDPVSLPSGRLEKTTTSSLHHVAQHRPTGSETTPPYAPRSSRFGSELPSVEDDVDVWRYAIIRVACQKR